MPIVNDPVEIAKFTSALSKGIARPTTLNPVDIANFETIIDIANIGIAVKALEQAEFPFKFTITREHGIPENDVMALFAQTAGRLKTSLVVDLQNSKFETDKTTISFFVSDSGMTDDESFTRHEKIFLKAASFWLERCYNIALYQGFIKKEDKVFIAGGALNRFYRRALTAKTPWVGSIGDVDFWFMEPKGGENFRERWGIGEKFPENAPENAMKSYGSKGVYSTIGLDPLYNMSFQFIHFTDFDPETIAEQFDFRHCCPFWTSDDKTLYVKPDDFKYIKEQLLIPCNEATVTEKRLRKYQEQGFQKIFLPPTFQTSQLNRVATIDWYIDNLIPKIEQTKVTDEF